MKIELNSQRIVVTGASRGIGLAITKLLLESGAEVIALYNTKNESLDELKRSQPSALQTYRLDLSHYDDIVAFFNTVTQDKKVDGVILNAGVAISSSLEESLADWYNSWKQTMRINLDAPGLLTRLFLPHFRENMMGRFLYIASRASHRGDTIEYMGYGASKAGMANLVKTVARYEGKNNIKAFGIAPGFTKTEMAQDFIDQYGQEVVLKDIALNSMTRPEDIAPAAVFFMSGLADHATGAILDINAGSYVR